MKSYVLRDNLAPEDNEWRFTLPADAFQLPPKKDASITWGKQVKFSKVDAPKASTTVPTPSATTRITFQMVQFSSNRVIRTDDHSKYVLVSFDGFRLPEPSTMRDGMEYIEKFLNKGLWLNGVQYRFYHHSNSQLRGRSCWMRQANSDKELDERIYALGNYGKIMNAAKRAKRIGLLFSTAEIDYILDPKYTLDIADIENGDELFSDGCGLISRKLMTQLSRAKKILFRGNRYTPAVIQIRYLGYKGVLMLHPEMDKTDKTHLVHFRKSMKKFTATIDSTFSVVNYSKPYSFGRLNNDIIALINSIGVTTEKLLAKQQQYFEWIKDTTKYPISAMDFMSAVGKFEWVERILLDGLEGVKVQDAIRAAQKGEMMDMRPSSQEGKFKSRMIIHQSRRLFGVCDPFGVLKEGQVHIKITSQRTGATTPINADVLVVRNPCLHPGDCLKLRATEHPKLAHLVDCLVFASVAKPGHHAAPSMSSGGDLDGDEYFVCWDPDLVQPIVAESYDYLPNKESASHNVTRADLVRHFAFYSGAGVASVSRLHAQWARIRPNGTLCKECQELNALHSQSVDGARVKIPDRLKPSPKELESITHPFVIDELAAAATQERLGFAQSQAARSAPLVPGGTLLDIEEIKQLIVEILQSDSQLLVFTEFERFNLVLRLARHHNIPASELRTYLPHIDFGALSASEKISLSITLDLDAEECLPLWNSLFRSDILTKQDLYQRQLNRAYPLQRLYSSKIQGMPLFFQYLRRATQEYTRKLLVIQTDERFAVGIFMRGPMPWDEVLDPVVGQNVVVCSFMPQSTSQNSLHRACGAGYKLHLSNGRFQLYDKVEAATWVFITKPAKASGAEVATSIALERIDQRVRKQMGRVNRAPIANIELHVISNRDHVAHQYFDLWFQHVPTEQIVRRFEREVHHYEKNSLKAVDWDDKAFAPFKSYFATGDLTVWYPERLTAKPIVELEQLMSFCVKYHQEDDLFKAFKALLFITPLPSDSVIKQLEAYPALSFAILHAYPPSEEGLLPDIISPLAFHVLEGVVKSANAQPMACLVALEKAAGDIGSLSVEKYLALLDLAACSVRSKEVVQEALIVLSDARRAFSDDTPANRYMIKHSLAVAVDRAEEAADTCPCDDRGRPRLQRTPPIQTTLSLEKQKPGHIKATIRIDARSTIRLHSHVRLQAASRITNEIADAPIMDGLVVSNPKGEYIIELLHPPPPEVERLDWNLYDAGSTATSKAMMDALRRLSEERSSSCAFFSSIIGDVSVESEDMINDDQEGEPIPVDRSLNESQAESARLCDHSRLSLIWGPPGTGKTTVVVQILRRLLQGIPEGDNETKILMTASTHNAVDNVLERFNADNAKTRLLSSEQILRVATDIGKVSKKLHEYTINARVGGDMNENNKLFKQAKLRVESARIVFTTCAGAGLGILRSFNFDIALIDEASQLTEPCALIPLVKGTRKAILVGDHVQLRPSVKRLGAALELDVSMLERLYKLPGASEMRKSMLQIQYRFPQELAAFPSREFYEGRLQTGTGNSKLILGQLEQCSFPWPRQPDGTIIPTVFVECKEEEDMEARSPSKKNEGQARVVESILALLSTSNNASATIKPEFKVAVLTPYTNQVREIKRQTGISECYTVDSFQGRESDVIIFSSVRCNVEAEVGFVEDERRLNVMWTRARLALIVVGDRRTMTQRCQIWKRAIDACVEVKLPVEEAATSK